MKRSHFCKKTTPILIINEGSPHPPNHNLCSATNDDHTIHVHVAEKISWSSNFLHCTRISICIRKLIKIGGDFRAIFQKKTWTTCNYYKTIINILKVSYD